MGFSLTCLLATTILDIVVIIVIVNKRVQNAILGCNLKNDRMTLVSFQSKLFNITVIQVYATTSSAEEAEADLIHDLLLS